MMKVTMRGWIHAAAGLCLLCDPSRVTAQFDEIPVPEEMSRLEFMIGDWQVEGTFRTPDQVRNRTLWYTTRGGGVTRFDGTAWVAFQPGDSPVADSVIAEVTEPGAPYEFSSEMNVTWGQDGFLLQIDEGRTSGSTFIFFDTAAQAWKTTEIHAPSNSAGGATAALADGLPVFEGRATDRRGPRLFRRRYEVHGPDHFTVRTDITFDEGVTWLDDQIVLQVRRR